MTELERLADAMKRIQHGDAWHGLSLREILVDVSAGQAAARPIPATHSIWELVLHIAAWEEAFCQRLEGIRVDEPAEGDFPALPESVPQKWAHTLARLDQAHKRLIEAISRLNESALDQLVVGKDYTVGYMLHGIIRHHVYHAGQIRLLQKLL